jgi:hypothetical protein
MKMLAMTTTFLVLAAGSLAVAAGEKDCLLKGTVQHGVGAGEATTQVKIHSISSFDDESHCSVRRDQKMEFKLPQDPRLQKAPSGSSVEYRYRTDDKGESSAELISVGA